MDKTDALLNERETTHGDYQPQIRNCRTCVDWRPGYGGLTGECQSWDSLEAGAATDACQSCRSWRSK